MSINKLLKAGILLLALCMTGCSDSQKEYQWEAMDKLKDTPVESIDRISFDFETEGGRLAKETVSAAEISDIYELLCQVSIVEPTNIGYDDAGLSIYIHTDKEEIVFGFESDVIITDKGRYLVDNIRPLEKYLYMLLDVSY